MLSRYVRNSGALSENDMELLRKKKVFIAGCGGLGGYICDELLRIGIGELKIADGDRFDISNLNRQLFSASDTLGGFKASVAGKYARRVNPDVKFIAENVFVTEDNVHSLVRGYDCVVDALDNIPSRRILKKACDELSIPYVYGSVLGWTAQCALSMPGDGFIERLYASDTEEKDKSVLSFTAGLCASMQASLCVNLLIGRNTDVGRLYLFDLSENEFHTLKI